MNVLLLAAGVGKRLAPYSEARPKCLMEVDGATLLERHLLLAERAGATSFTIVVGHLHELVEAEVTRLKVRVPLGWVHNDAYRRGSIVSLKKGIEHAHDDVIFMDTDVLYHPDVLGELFTTKHRSCLLIDATSEETGEEMMVGVRNGSATAIARRVSPLGRFDVQGESVGFFRIAKEHLSSLSECIDEAIRSGGEDQEYETALSLLFGRISMGYERVDGLPWTEIDFAEDLKRAREHVAPLLPALYPDMSRSVSDMARHTV